MSDGEDNQTAPTNPDFLGIAAAAVFLGVKQGVVRAAIHARRLPFEVAYGRKVIARTALTEYKARTQPDGVPRRGRPRKQQH